MYYFHRCHFQAGLDYVYTYGPLGYFPSFVYEPGFFPYKLTWELATKLIFALACLGTLRRIPGFIPKLVFACALLAFASLALFEFTYVLTILQLGLFLIVSERPRAGVIAAVATVLAVFSLVKVTLLILSGVTIFCMCLRLLANRARWRSLLPVGCYTGALLLAWVLAGQNPSHLHAFFRGSLQLSNSYTEAMCLYGSASEVRIGTLVLAFCAGAIITLPTRRLLNARDAGVLALLGFFMFAEWKQGFVRHDLHSLTLFCYLLLLPFLLTAFLRAYDWNASPRCVLLSYCVPLAAIGIWQAAHLPRSFDGLISRVGDHYLSRLALCRNLDAYVRMQNQYVAAAMEQWRLPRIAAAVGDASVDVIGYEQGIALANSLNWRPRPIFQSYAAHNTFLMDLNAEFFRDRRAPEFVLYKLQSIDGRLPILDDGPAQMEILQRYQPLFVEKSYLLMRRRTAESPVTGPGEKSELVLKLGEEVPLPDLGKDCVRAAFDIRYTGWGKLRNLFYKPPCINIRLRTADGGELCHRIVPAMAEAGFLINPFLESEADVMGLFGGAPEKRIVSLCIMGDGHAPWALRRSISMTLQRLPGLKAAVEQVGSDRISALASR
jgi:hypothetical protein